MKNQSLSIEISEIDLLNQKLAILQSLRDVLTQEKEEKLSKDEAELKQVMQQIAETGTKLAEAKEKEEKPGLTTSEKVTSENLQFYQEFFLATPEGLVSKRAGQLLRLFAQLMKVEGSYGLKDFEKMINLYKGFVFQVQRMKTQPKIAELLEKLKAVLKYYLAVILEHINSQSAEETFEIKASAPYQEQKVVRKYEEIKASFQSGRVELSIPETFFSALDRMRDQLLQNKLCQRDKTATRSDFFREKKTLFGKDADHLGVPPIFNFSKNDEKVEYKTITEDKDFQKLMALLAENFKVDNALLQKIFTFETKDFQIVKKRFAEDDKRRGFLKLCGDYKEISESLTARFVPCREGIRDDSDKYMHRFLLEQLYLTLTYLIDMSIVKYPAWLNGHSINIVVLIQEKLNENISEAKLEKHFKNVIGRIEFGKCHFEELKSLFNSQRRDQEFTTSDFENCRGYLGLIAENLEYFPTLIKDQEALKKDHEFLVDLAKRFDAISEGNALVLKMYFTYKSSFVKRSAFRECTDFVAQKMRLNQLKQIDQRLKTESISSEARNGLWLRKKEILGGSLRFIASQQKTLQEQGNEKLQIKLRKQEFLSQMLMIQSQIYELVSNFRELEYKIDKASLEKKFEKSEETFSAIIQRVTVLSDELVGKMTVEDLTIDLSAFPKHLEDIKLSLRSASQFFLQSKDTTMSTHTSGQSSSDFFSSSSSSSSSSSTAFRTEYVNSYRLYKEIQKIDKSFKDLHALLSSVGRQYEIR